VVASPRVGSFQRAESIGWVLPIDDTHFRVYVAGRVTESGALRKMRSTFNGKSWFDLTEEEHQRFPGDFEAQVGQGAITLHSEEHLVSSDRGVALLRKALRTQVERVAAGERPMGVVVGEAACLVNLEAGNFLE
jgi:hypothetical protein